MKTVRAAPTTVRWRWFSWPEAIVYVVAFVLAPLFVGDVFGRPWLIAVVALLVVFSFGCMHWLVAPRGFKRVALVYGPTGFTHPMTSKREIPWRAVSDIGDPGRLGRTMLVSLTDSSYRPPPPRFMRWLSPKPDSDVIVMLEGWKINADMQALCADFKRLRDNAAT